MSFCATQTISLGFLCPTEQCVSTVTLGFICPTEERSTGGTLRRHVDPSILERALREDNEIMMAIAYAISTGTICI